MKLEKLSLQGKEYNLKDSKFYTKIILFFFVEKIQRLYLKTYVDHEDFCFTDF